MGMIDNLSLEQKASLGSILGAFIGDSIGSYVEFKTGMIDHDDVRLALTMPGGGTWSLAPG